MHEATIYSAWLTAKKMLKASSILPLKRLNYMINCTLYERADILDTCVPLQIRPLHEESVA